MSAAAATFPSWVMLEPFVFRRDGDDSFPDESKAPIRASATTSWGATFTIAFSLADPPLISRLYAQLPVPGFPDPRRGRPLAILATHRHLALLRVATETPAQVTVQDFFVYDAGEKPSSSSLKALPPCTEPQPPFDYNYTSRHCRLPRRRPPLDHSPPRLLSVKSMGLLCRGQEEFVVAELTLYKPNRSKVFADICLLQSSSCSTPAADDKLLGGTWRSMRVDILCSDNNPDDDVWQLCCWETDAVVPFNQWLCWIDYCRGILFCDVFRDPNPSVSFLRFPLDSFPSTNIRSTTLSLFYRGVSVVDHGHGRMLKFVNVARRDGIAFGALKPGTGFTITCHTLKLGGSGTITWEEEHSIDSKDLWNANLHLPRGILMFPQVDVNRPHVVHLLYIEFGYAKKKMWVVSIDMSTKIVESFSLYINGHEGLQTDDADLIRDKSMSPMAFLPCEFPKYLSRKSKDME